jgi:hypothetical protein
MMRANSRKRMALAGAVMAAAVALVAGACGGGDEDGVAAAATPGTGDGGVVGTATAGIAGGGATSSSMVAPDTFLTFEGRTYRLVELLQANLEDESAFQRIGEATEADIDQEDLTVYRKADDPDAVYTFAAAAAAQGDPLGTAGEESGAPALWYRWTLEP